VYARTSSGSRWIKEVVSARGLDAPWSEVLNVGSASASAESTTTTTTTKSATTTRGGRNDKERNNENNCDHQLDIFVTTDGYGRETSITLNEEGTTNGNGNGPLILHRKYLVNFYDNKHTVCLERNTCYDFTIFDSDHTMCYDYTGVCGSFQIHLNGDAILMGDPNFSGSEFLYQFCTNAGDPTTSPYPTEAPVESTPNPTEAPNVDTD